MPNKDCQICTARTLCQASLKPHRCHFHLDEAEAARRKQTNNGECKGDEAHDKD